MHLIKSLLISISSLLPAISHGQWDINYSIDAGKTALDYHDYKTSVNYLSRVITTRPNNHKAFYYRGLAKFNLGDYFGCEKDMSTTISLNPYYYDAYEMRGNARIKQEKYELAAQDFQIFKEYKQDQYDIWYNLVFCTLKANDYVAADSLSDVIIKKWPKSAEGYILKCRAKYGMNNDNDSDSEFLVDQALKLEPYNHSALSIKANFLMKSHKWEEATQVYSRALHVHPKNTQNLINRGLCKMMTGSNHNAISDFRLALDIDPDNELSIKCTQLSSKEDAETLINQIIYSDNYMMPETIAYVQKETDINKKYALLPPQYLSDFQKEAYNPDKSFTVGYKQLYLQNYLIAITELTESINHNAQIPETYYNRAFAYAKIKSNYKAIEDLNIAILKRPLYAEAYYNRGLLKLLINDKEGAKNDFSKAAEQGIEIAYEIIKELNR